MIWKRIVLGNNTRIDTYLAKNGLRVSRSRIKKLIENGNVLVNGKPVKPSYVVKDNDEILVNYEPFEPAKAFPENIPIDIIYEDEDILIVDKDKNMVVHPAKGHLTGTLVNAVLYHSKNLSEGSSAERPGVIHRLDKDTTGLIIFAKNNYAHNILSEQLAKRELERRYLAVVWGVVPIDEGEINAPIGRHQIFKEKMAVTPFGSKDAITKFKVIYRGKYASILLLRLKTGRTHQIRVHLSHLGFPVIGDPEYGGRNKNILQKIGLQYKEDFEKILSMIDRQALHAIMVRFVHPRTKKEVNFFSRLKEDMKEVIKYIIKEKI